MENDAKEIAISVAKGIAKVLVSSIPTVGPIMTSVYSEVVTVALQKRRENWERSIEDRLEAIEDSKIVDKLVGNESFVTCLVQATMQAMQTHQEEKYKLLANAVANSIDSELSEDKKQIFLRWIERYSDLHIQILTFLNDPVSFLFRAGILPRNSSEHLSLKQAIEAVYPEKRQDEDLITVIIRDLYSDGLINSKGTNLNDFVKKGFTTQIAKEFLGFISD